MDIVCGHRGHNTTNQVYRRYTKQVSMTGPHSKANNPLVATTKGHQFKRLHKKILSYLQSSGLYESMVFEKVQACQFRVQRFHRKGEGVESNIVHLTVTNG